MSISPQAFKTKSFRKDRLNPSFGKAWPIAIDVGYSSVKVMSPNTVVSFPSCAKKVAYGTADNAVGIVDSTNIALRDNKGNEWFVGNAGQRIISPSESDSSTAAMYVRDRYYSREFKVISEAGLALGMLKNKFGNPLEKAIKVMTGLPPEYMSADKNSLIDALSGEHSFSVKLGSNPNWIDFNFSLDPEDISVMEQPMGTLISIATDQNGGVVPKAKDYFSKNLLIFDAGFGTLDTFDLRSHFIHNNKTWNDLGMRRVLEEVSKEIKDRYKETILLPAMQEVLGKGYFVKQDKQNRRTKKIEIADILEECNRKVALEALDTINSYYSFLQNHDYLVVTGGTGGAWIDIIRDFYSGMETLIIIDGAVNDTITPVFSNVRGYYFQLINTLKNEN